MAPKTKVANKTISKPKTPVKSKPPSKAASKTYVLATPPVGVKMEGVAPTPDSLKISSWNVNGLRAVLKEKNGLHPLPEYLKNEAPDILCLQEIKIDDSLVEQFEHSFPGYTTYFFCTTKKKGYAGVAVLVKAPLKPLKVTRGMGVDKHDDVGRVITLEFEKLVMVGVYVANAGRALVNLDYRIDSFDVDMQKHNNRLREETGKPVIWLGDLNVAYEEIDIFDSAGNQKSAGHTPQERKSFGEVLGSGEWIDVFRQKYPEKVAFTFWSATRPSYRMEGKGWRLDYFVTTKDLFEDVEDVLVRDTVYGSDHCPVVLLLPARYRV